ncbi:uncharacterized protein LOC134715207 [Mytilus trossulus]|uniref:uncharacterized protein LOC134715207 n=1 Tax=Mytilus trossulus TaxID=6551 RepID=UPI0030061123
MPKLRETKLYQYIATKSLDELRTECYNHISSGKDVNIKDSDTGETYLHCLCDQMERFMDENGVSIIYILACKGVDLDIQDNLGETFLHKIVRMPGAYRALVAAVRCGADMMVLDNRDRTAENILHVEKPEGWQEMLHWWNKFKPGLYRATLADNPDRTLVEKLMKYWCRVNIVKDGQDYSVKTRLRQRAKDIDFVYLIEKYENTIEFALAALSGKTQILLGWKKRIENNPDVLKTINFNMCDWSYQRSLDSPEVPMPLLFYIWRMNRVDMTELLIEYGVDSTLLYSADPSKEQVKPLFFQLVCGEQRPSEEIINRTLQKSDLSAKNYDGQTLLYEAIKHRSSSHLVEFLLKRGINIGARDKHGQTARDFALSLNKKGSKYVKMIDQYVLDMVKNSNIQGVEALILQGYDHLLDIIDEKDELGVLSLARLTGSQYMVELLSKVEKSKEHVDKMFRIAHKGRLAELRPLLGKKYSSAVDICGRNVCHIAVVYKRREFIKCFTDNYTTLLNKKDNLGRTPFHYAQVLLEGDELTEYMLQKGADTNVKDVLGRTPLDYKCSSCGQRSFYTLQKEVQNYAMDVYVAQTKFEESLSTAIKNGNLNQVSSLVSGLKSQSKDTDYLSRYNIILFNCLEHNQEEIAIYLTQQGMNTNIFKQYDKCDPNDQLCAMLECDHSPKSFKDVAKQKNCQRILNFLDEINEDLEKEIQEKKRADFMTFSQFGLV